MPLAGDEVEGDGDNLVIGEGAGNIQSGIGGQQGGVTVEGVEIQIPEVDQTHENSLCTARSSNSSRFLIQWFKGWLRESTPCNIINRDLGRGHICRGEGDLERIGWVSCPIPIRQWKKKRRRSGESRHGAMTALNHFMRCNQQSFTQERVQEMLGEDLVVTTLC